MPDYGIVAVDRALEVLSAFRSESGSISLAELARLLNVNKTTTLRICGSLERAGYLRRGSNSRYWLGPAACALGKYYEADIHLDDVVIPELLRLAKIVRESTSFHVRVGNARLCIYRVDADHMNVDNVRTGDWLPLKLGAAGHILMAYTNSKSTQSQAVCSRGYAFSFGERDPTCAAVAVPVFKFGHDLCGALSISGPQQRFTEQFAWKILPLTIAAAERMSFGMGASSGEPQGNWNRATPADKSRATWQDQETQHHAKH